MRLALYTERHNLLWDLMAPMWREADQIPAIESAWTFDHLHVYPTQFSPARNDAQASLGQRDLMSGSPVRWHPACDTSFATVENKRSDRALRAGSL